MKPAGTHNLTIEGHSIPLTTLCPLCSAQNNISSDCLQCEGRGIVLTRNGVHILNFVREFIPYSHD